MSLIIMSTVSNYFLTNCFSSNNSGLITHENVNKSGYFRGIMVISDICF